MEDKELIEEELKAQGLNADSWRDEDDGLEAVLGRWRVTEDDEDQGLYSDDEGELSASVVGAVEYRNQRVMFSIMPDGIDAKLECRPFENVEPV